MLTENEQKRKELAKYLDVAVDEIQIEDEDSVDIYNKYYTANGTYLVLTEEESEQAVRDDVETLFDDIGMDSFTPSFQEKIYDKYLDDDWFRDYCKEDYESYATDIESEPDTISHYANRLIQECIEKGLIKEDECNEDGEYTGQKDLIEELSTAIFEEIGNEYDSYAEWYKFNFGNENLTYLIKNNHVSLDFDGIVEDCIDMDGYGHFIARYDGNTVELDTYYAYLMDNVDERE